MKLAILFLGWLVVGFVVALAIGKLIREVGLNVADDEYPDRRFQMRRASMSRSADAPPASTQEQRRREPDRRKGDDVPRKRR
jgi:hypothetical protein